MIIFHENGRKYSVTPEDIAEIDPGRIVSNKPGNNEFTYGKIRITLHDETVLYIDMAQFRELIKELGFARATPKL